MTQIASSANYKRREIPGQLQMDFGDTLVSPNIPPAPAKPASPSVPATPPSALVPKRETAPVQSWSTIPCADELDELLSADCKPESAAAKVDDAPGYKLCGKRPPDALSTLPNELSRLAASIMPSAAHFVTDSRAMELILQAASEVRPGEVRGVRVRFFPFRSTLYSFKMDRARVVAVKFHVAFRRSGDAVILQAARLMLCRKRKLRKTLARSEYDAFVRSLPSGDFKLPGARRAFKKALNAQGVFRQLDESFQRVNTTYFASQLKQPDLCWSPVRARRILGSYQERNDRLIVSRVFDSPNVPPFVLDFLMYHELLHKFLGVGRRGDGRRCMHGPEFKELERKFARFEEAQEFLKRL